jgi:cytochrome P450 family 135
MRTTPLLEEGQRHGDPWTLRLPGSTWVFTAEPALVKEVFEADPVVLQHEVLLTPLVGTQSLLTLDEPEHSAVRRLLQPPFQHDRLAAHRDTIRHVCEERLAEWPRDETVPLLPRLLDIALGAVFGVIFDTEGGRNLTLRGRFAELLEWGANPLRVVLHQQLVLRGRKSPRSFRRLLEPVDALLFEEINRTRHDPRLDERADVVAMLVRALDEGGNPLTDRQIRDHLVTLTFLGHRSTAVALAWAFERLARHPEAIERIREEAETEGEEYVDAVVKETLRLRPPFPFVVRAVKQPYRLGGYDLPPGTMVALNSYMLHRRPDLYPEPESFRPERFLEQRPDPYKWIPFGGGGRACIGAGFALQEMKIVLRTVLERFDLTPAEPGDEGIRRLGVQFSPSNGARVLIQERATAAADTMVAAS